MLFNIKRDDWRKIAAVSCVAGALHLGKFFDLGGLHESAAMVIAVLLGVTAWLIMKNEI